MPVRVIPGPLPLVLTLPGLRVTIHEPDGRELSATLPDATTHVGWVMLPIAGADGTGGGGLIVTLADDTEVQPGELVTVNVYVPEEMSEIAVLIPVPMNVIPPGVRVNVHVPVAGKPFNTTLPVETVHEGCVIVPMEGALGVAG
jgi:hypothetical protein